MNIKSIFFTISMLFILVGCGSDDTAQVIEDKNTKVEKTQNYVLKTMAGKTINIELINNLLLSKELNGKILLVNFWATWCPPCKKEIPSFVKLQEKYKDKFVVLGVLMEKQKDKKELQKFLEEFKVNFPISVDNDNFLLAKDIGNVQKYPESFLFSSEGLFIKKFIGEVDQIALESYIIDAFK